MQPVIMIIRSIFVLYNFTDCNIFYICLFKFMVEILRRFSCDWLVPHSYLCLFVGTLQVR